MPYLPRPVLFNPTPQQYLLYIGTSCTQSSSSYHHSSQSISIPSIIYTTVCICHSSMLSTLRCMCVYITLCVCVVVLSILYVYGMRCVSCVCMSMYRMYSAVLSGVLVYAWYITCSVVYIHFHMRDVLYIMPPVVISSVSMYWDIRRRYNSQPYGTFVLYSIVGVVVVLEGYRVMNAWKHQTLSWFRR